MHMIRGMGSIVAALMALRLAPIHNAMAAHSARGAAKRRKTGKTYPHSSTRQRARYARQIAAGQIGG